MEDGFSSYSSLYDTSSLLQFCNGERGREDRGTGTERRGPGRAAGEAAPSRSGSRRRIVLRTRGRASPRLRAPGLPHAHPGLRARAGLWFPEPQRMQRRKARARAPEPGGPGNLGDPGTCCSFASKLTSVWTVLDAELSKQITAGTKPLQDARRAGCRWTSRILLGSLGWNQHGLMCSRARVDLA